MKFKTTLTRAQESDIYDLRKKSVFLTYKQLTTPGLDIITVDDNDAKRIAAATLNQMGANITPLKIEYDKPKLPAQEPVEMKVIPVSNPNKDNLFLTSLSSDQRRIVKRRKGNRLRLSYNQLDSPHFDGLKLTKADLAKIDTSLVARKGAMLTPEYYKSLRSSDENRHTYSIGYNKGYSEGVSAGSKAQVRKSYDKGYTDGAQDRLKQIKELSSLIN